jgi:hypothetical protein
MLPRKLKSEIDTSRGLIRITGPKVLIRKCSDMGIAIRTIFFMQLLGLGHVITSLSVQLILVQEFLLVAKREGGAVLYR